MARVRILSGSEPTTLIEKNITANGTYNASADDADGYSSVNVNVVPILTTKTITENGTYSAHSEPGAPDGYSTVTVDVPTGPDINNKYFRFVSTKANRTQGTEIYTCKVPGKYLAIDIDIIGESNTGHSTIATISSTGTISDYAEQYTTYGSNNNRDCTIRIAIIDLALNDTVTFSNSTSSNYASRLHALIPTDIIGVDANWIDTIIDSARDNSINKSGSTKSLIICAQSSGVNNSSGNPTITNPVNIDTIIDIFSPGLSANIGFTSDNWSCTMNTDSTTNYVSKIYAIFDISR